jgi:hypothetical protein
VHDDIWLVSFIDCDLGYFDLETRVLERLENPSAQSCYLCSRYRSVTPFSGLDLPTLFLGRTNSANLRYGLLSPFDDGHRHVAHFPNLFEWFRCEVNRKKSEFERNGLFSSVGLRQNELNA